MSKYGELMPALVAALALSACAVDDFDDSVTDTRVALGDKTALTPEEQFPEVRTNCELPGAALTRHDSGWRLSLPSQIYAARKSQPIAGRIACVENWAREHGLTFAVAEGG